MSRVSHLQNSMAGAGPAYFIKKRRNQEITEDRLCEIARAATVSLGADAFITRPVAIHGSLSRVVRRAMASVQGDVFQNRKLSYRNTGGHQWLMLIGANIVRPSAIAQGPSETFVGSDSIDVDVGDFTCGRIAFKEPRDTRIRFHRTKQNVQFTGNLQLKLAR